LLEVKLEAVSISVKEKRSSETVCCPVLATVPTTTGV
jgi:hypothetical protein